MHVQNIEIEAVLTAKHRYNAYIRINEMKVRRNNWQKQSEKIALDANYCKRYSYRVVSSFSDSIGFNKMPPKSNEAALP